VLEEAVLLLHRAETELSDNQRELLAGIRRNDLELAGKKVLVVDDDVRNIFALTSVLEQHHLQVVHAENGRAGIETLLKTPDVDGVLMDIMMPEMDGYETTRAIRQIAEFRTLPIIAVTAKAMKGDRAKCIEAGASDYITKPVDLDQLFSVLRVWLIRNRESSQAALTAGK
jgi:CheY-like chemotaxis protein